MITVYGKQNCPSCSKAKALLEQMGVQYEYVDVFDSPDAMELLVESGLKTVPQVYQDGKLIGGFEALNEHFLLLG